MLLAHWMLMAQSEMERNRSQSIGRSDMDNIVDVVEQTT